MTSIIHQKPESETYTFQSKPRSVQRSVKYRLYEEPDSPPQYANIMWDRRVIRGNTYAQNILPVGAQPDPIAIKRQQELRRRALAKRRARDQLEAQSPEPAEGRKHAQVQTELYLEELTDRIEEADVDTQTDAFLDRPPSPLYVPGKTGQDNSTQIFEGDLFDFDIEVKPILELLVGKTMEQALIEVLEEEELANLRQQQQEFEELRNAELVEKQRLEEQERRHREEKERRMKQQREVLKEEKEVADKVAARAFAINYLTDLVPFVFNTLRDNGYFYDPIERDVEQGFIPYLMDEVVKRIDKSDLARAVLDLLIRDVEVKRLKAFEKGPSPSSSKRSSKKVSLVLPSDQENEQPSEIEAAPGQPETGSTADEAATEQPATELTAGETSTGEQPAGVPPEGEFPTLDLPDSDQSAINLEEAPPPPEAPGQ